MTKAIRESQRVLEEFHRRRQQRALVDYHPSPVQKEVHDACALKPITLFVGPNGVGKTTCALYEAVSWGLGYRPWDRSKTKNPPCRIGLFGENFSHAIQEDMVPILQAILPRGLVEHVDRLRADQPHRWRWKNGTIMKAMSYKQPARDYEGVLWDFVILNEPSPRHVWVPTARGLAKRGGHALFVFTPLGANASWMYDEQIGRAHV